MPLSGVLGLLTSESGQEGDWLGVEAVVSLLPHRYLCPRTHPVSTAGVRVNEPAWTHLWGAQTSGRVMEAVEEEEARPSHQPYSPPVLSLSRTVSCLCLCFPCLRSSCHCCLACGPFGKVQSICPEASLPLKPSPSSYPQSLWPWPFPSIHLVLVTHLRGPLSPSMWLSSPSPCMSGTDATKSFKKSNCCSSSMHCFLKKWERKVFKQGPQNTYGRIETTFSCRYGGT